MKLLDEKGRLFGKINLIDFIVAVFLLSLIPLSYLGYQLYLKRYGSFGIKEQPYVLIELDCKFTRISPEIAKLIAVGDKETGRNGDVIGEIIWLGKEKPYEYILDIGVTDKITKTDPQLKEVFAKVRLKLKIYIANNTLYYKDNLINIYSEFPFQTDKYSAQAVIIKELPVRKTMQLDMNCRLIKLSPETLKLIALGDKELDEDGNVIGEITWLGKNRPYEYELKIGDREKTIKMVSDLREVFAKLRLNVQLGDNNSIYYKDKEISINSIPLFITDKYSVEVKPAFIESPTKRGEIVNTDVDCRLIKLSPETLKLIALGDKELDEDGNVIGEITWLGEPKSYEYEFIIGGTDKVIKTASELKEVAAKLRLKAQTADNNKIYYNNEEVTVNFPVKFKTNKYKIDAVPKIVISEEKWVRIKAEFAGIIPEITSIISEDDVESDAEGKAQARIERIISVKSSEVLSLRDSNWAHISHPFLKDLEISLALLCKEKNGILYYKNYPVKMGNMITFSSDLYAISGTIIGLETE